jgi:plasmanylethanolamine desaturase
MRAKQRLVVRSRPVVSRHLELSRSQRVFSAISIAAALILLGVCAVRVAAGVDLLQWWVPLALVGGIAAADFGSGLVHWFADTWGRDDMPVIGRRLLVPFRLHHVHPDDLIERPFVDCNGDVAFVTTPVLIGLLAVPLGTPWGGPLAVFLLGLSGLGMMTNQIHQWAHMPSPPRPVRLLQRCGLFLGQAAHAEHHDRPYDANYCITTGWCNRPLEAIGFFRRLEAAITRLTGAQPREDDRRYEEIAPMSSSGGPGL